MMLRVHSISHCIEIGPIYLPRGAARTQRLKTTALWQLSSGHTVDLSFALNMREETHEIYQGT
jgi:hypothetical protein